VITVIINVVTVLSCLLIPFSNISHNYYYYYIVNGTYIINSESFLNTTRVKEEDTQRNHLKSKPDWTETCTIEYHSV